MLDYTEEQKTVVGVPELYPTSIAPLLNTCLFGLHKDASIALGLHTQTKALTDLNESSKAFLAASQSTTWSDGEWSNYRSAI